MNSWSPILLLLTTISLVEDEPYKNEELIYTQEVLWELRENPLDLNSAEKEDLQKLPYLNEILIMRIIKFREKQNFEKLEDLLLIEGITPEILHRLKSFITVKKERTINRLKLRWNYSRLKNSYLRINYSSPPLRYFSSFKAGFNTKFLSLNNKNFLAFLGDFVMQRNLGLIFSLPTHYSIKKRISGLEDKEIIPLTFTHRKFGLLGGGIRYRDKDWEAGIITSKEVFASLADFWFSKYLFKITFAKFFKHLKQKSEEFTQLPMVIGVAGERVFEDVVITIEGGYAQKGRGIAFSLSADERFYSFNFDFGFLEGFLSPFSFYSPKISPWAQTSLILKCPPFSLTLHYRSRFYTGYDSFPHRLRLKVRSNLDKTSFSFQTTRHLKLEKVKSWNNRLSVERILKENFIMGLSLADYYRRGKENRRKYILSAKLSYEKKSWEVSGKLYQIFITENLDVPSYLYEEEVIDENLLFLNTKHRFTLGFGYKKRNWQIKLKNYLEKNPYWQFGIISYCSLQI